MKNPMTEIGKTRTGLLTPRGLCIHAQSGKGTMAKTCIHHYECWHCAYDQWIDAMETEEKAPEELLNLNGDILSKAA